MIEAFLRLRNLNFPSHNLQNNKQISNEALVSLVCLILLYMKMYLIVYNLGCTCIH